MCRPVATGADAGNDRGQERLPRPVDGDEAGVADAEAISAQTMTMCAPKRSIAAPTTGAARIAAKPFAAMTRPETL